MADHVDHAKEIKDLKANCEEKCSSLRYKYKSAQHIFWAETGKFEIAKLQFRLEKDIAENEYFAVQYKFWAENNSATKLWDEQDKYKLWDEQDKSDGTKEAGRRKFEAQEAKFKDAKLKFEDAKLKLEAEKKEFEDATRQVKEELELEIANIKKKACLKRQAAQLESEAKRNRTEADQLNSKAAADEKAAAELRARADDPSQLVAPAWGPQGKESLPKSEL